MYNFYLEVTYRTVGKIAPSPVGVKSFEPLINAELNPDFFFAA